ncbi:hypothetical protein AMA2_31 [Achromobacter phage AMA2]|nr:hypothetical protein AMA2_31 [Achromobacter phage AMA2]
MGKQPVATRPITTMLTSTLKGGGFRARVPSNKILPPTYSAFILARAGLVRAGPLTEGAVSWLLSSGAAISWIVDAPGLYEVC